MLILLWSFVLVSPIRRYCLATGVLLQTIIHKIGVRRSLMSQVGQGGISIILR
jgi:hypothetical protein